MAWGKEKGIAAKALEAAYKEAQPEKTSGGPRGFAEMYYDWLAEASREEQEAHDYIMSNESQNAGLLALCGQLQRSSDTQSRVDERGQNRNRKNFNCSKRTAVLRGNQGIEQDHSLHAAVQCTGSGKTVKRLS